ncbi:hypothetical protein MSPP1_001529 [Malassezia sp. CBS 17886]|nr:hypothetical protein MSPP1_001529 [Malassezia sp. CBS 17886]
MNRVAPRVYTLSPPHALATGGDAQCGAAFTHLACVHVGAADLPPAVQSAMLSCWNETLEQGDTYPHEYATGQDGFHHAFLVHDMVLGILVRDIVRADAESDSTAARLQNHVQWPGQLGGFYYVKPNYPGRSSHICNAGFIVPSASRGHKLGTALGRSFLTFGPALGYKASVFNLVYETNKASARIWERLGFDFVGRIPKAGRLRRREAHTGTVSEEYVDALVVYKEFTQLDK